MNAAVSMVREFIAFEPSISLASLVGGLFTSDVRDARMPEIK